MEVRLMKIGIIGAMDTECEMIISQLEDRVEKKIAGFTYHQGRYADKEIVITVSSIGKVNSAVSTQIMINNFSPDFIINTGIAGGLDDRLKPLSMVIANKVTYHDFDEDIMRDYYPFQDYFKTDERAVMILDDILEEDKVHHYTGLIVTGDQFIESSEKKEELSGRFGALCVEMEGAAIGNTAFINDLPFVVIRCISDMADDGGKMTYDEFKVKASDESARTVLKFVERL